MICISYVNFSGGLFQNHIVWLYEHHWDMYQLIYISVEVFSCTDE